MGSFGTHAVNVSLFSSMPYDPVKDFAPIILVLEAEGLLVVHPSVPAQSVLDLIAYGRAHPGKLTYASAGMGTASHLAGELFKTMAKVEMTHVPYKGNVPAITDLLAGQTSLLFGTMPTVLPHAKAGKLRTLAITSENRSASAPEIPTFSESGVPALKDYAVEVYYGVMARSGTPADIVARLEGDLRKVLAMPEFAQRISTAGIDMFPRSAREMAAIMSADVARFREVIREAGIRPE